MFSSCARRLTLGLLSFGVLSLLAGARAHAQDPCASPANAIVARELLPGDQPSSEWDVEARRRRRASRASRPTSA